MCLVNRLYEPGFGVGLFTSSSEGKQSDQEVLYECSCCSDN